MKAWVVCEKNEFIATVVFAETRGKAKSIALTTEACEDCKFIDIETHRAPNMDKYYKIGKTEMDWFNKLDRIALVKDCGFICDYEYQYDDECQECSARKWCDSYLSKSNIQGDDENCLT